MTTTNETTIPVVKTSTPSNYPFSVQTKNTENWNTHDATVTLAAALEVAQGLQEQYPSLPVRIEHNAGGLVKTSIIPKFEFLKARGEHPHRTAIWSGAGEPPEIGARVEISINGIGPGTVEAYAVDDGYLGVMVRADEETRPAWHKAQNPVNGAFLTFGAELKVTLVDLYVLWDRLANIPVDEQCNLEVGFNRWPAGTSRETVWKWFEATHPKFVVGDVQQGIRVKD